MEDDEKPCLIWGSDKYQLFFSGGLEDPDAKEVKYFVEKQASLTESVLHTCETRDKLRECITTVFNLPTYGCPSKHDDKYFYLFNSGLQA